MSQTAPPNLLNPDGSPRLTVAQRRSQLDEIRFVDVRHLVYMSYKKPDLSPLMQYEDTLDNRDVVKLAALNYELNAGWLIRDGTESQGLPVSQPQPAVPPGVQVMSNTPPFNPPQQNGAPQQQQFAPPQQMQFAPPQGGPPPQQFAPPQQTFAPPQQQFQAPAQQMMQQPPPIASAQQAAAPQQQEQPSAPPTGRKRKGAAVAPPPAAGAPIPQQQAPVQQFQQPPAPQFQQPQGQVPVQQFQPQAPQGFVPQAQPVPQQFSAPQQQAPAPQAQAVDLSPVLGRLDGIAGLIQTQAKELAESKTLSLKLLAVLHHMYLVTPALQPQAGQPAVPRTLPEFQAYLNQFTGTP